MARIAGLRDAAAMQGREPEAEFGRYFDEARLSASEPNFAFHSPHPVSIAHPEGFAPHLSLARPAPAASRVAAEAPPAPSGSTRSAAIFVGSLVVAQVGVEAWSAAWAKWVQVNYSVDRYSTLTMISMFTSLAAGYLGGLAADKLGVKRTYMAATFLGAASAAATLALFKMHMLPFAALTGLAAARGFLGNVGRTAEQTIPISIFKGDQGALERFNSISQVILETAGIAVPFFISSLLGALGPLGTMSLLPITALASLGALFFVAVPERQADASVPAAGTTAEADADPALLRIGTLGYPAFVVLNILLYSILAIGYGNYVHPGSSTDEQALAAGVAGKIVSLYSLGGLVAGMILSGVLAAAWRKLRRSPEPPAETTDRLRSLNSIVFWTRLGALGLLGFVPFLWTSPMLAAAGMIPFGLTNVMGQLKLVSLIQANVPSEKRGKVMGGVRTASTVAATAGLFAFGRLLKRYPASPVPFWALLAVLAALAAYCLWISRRLSRYIAGQTAKPS